MAIAFGLVVASNATAFDSVLDCSSGSQSCFRFGITRKAKYQILTLLICGNVKCPAS